ncbi:MAG: hypothetical protein WBE34_14515 [Candidatus Nitrosopolaris sp.]
MNVREDLTLSIFAGEAAGSLVSVIDIIPLPNQRLFQSNYLQSFCGLSAFHGKIVEG